MAEIRDLVLDLGRRAQLFVADMGGMSLLAGRTIYDAITPPYGLRLLMGQMDYIAVRSVSIVGVAGLFVGLVLALQTAYGLARFGAKGTVGIIVGLSMVRELGPVVTAILVGGRVGSGFTAELGSMKVTEQIDAMRALGVNHIKKLVVPRVLITMLAMPMLTVIADALGIFGGMMISQYEFNVDYHQYYNTVTQYVEMADMLDGLGKTVVFGFLIGVVGCYNGLETRGGTEGLGRATTGTVVTCSLLIFISDFFLTKFFWWLAGW
ncbi:MAG TPA: ABC transporter permease [Candidatus Methylomirabilis sp.]|nr:ABC transporter permease [Candidatus Methylomirabilis sp.]